MDDVVNEAQTAATIDVEGSPTPTKKKTKKKTVRKKTVSKKKTISKAPTNTVAPTVTSRQKSPRQRTAPVRDKHSIAMVHYPIQLCSQDVQRYYERNYVFVSRRFHAAIVLMMDFNQTRAALTAEKIFMAKMEECFKHLSDAKSVVNEVIENRGITLKVDYSQSKTVDAITLTPLCNMYLDVLQSYDELNTLMYTAWRGGAMSLGFYDNERKRIKSILNKLTTAIRINTQPAVSLLKNPDLTEDEKDGIFMPLEETKTKILADSVTS